MFEVVDVHVSYGRIPALRGVDLELPTGTVAALLGPNGAGKSTLLGAISGVVPLEKGDVRLDGERLVGLAGHDVAARGVVQIPEGRGIFPGLSVRDNLAVVSSRHGDSTIEDVLEHFPRLQERLSQLAGTMSGGEQQMLAVALALLARPKVLLVDELSLGLAPRIVDELFAILGRLRADGLTILLVEQFVHRALELADHAYVLSRGRVVFRGTATELKNSGVADAYLGTSDPAVVSSRSVDAASTSRPPSTRLSVPVRADEARRLAALADRRGVRMEDLLHEAVALTLGDEGGSRAASQLPARRPRRRPLSKTSTRGRADR